MSATRKRDPGRASDVGASGDVAGPGTPSSPWKAPTRRAFVAMIGAATAALAVRNRDVLVPSEEDRPRSPWTGKTRWIGHC